MCAFDTLRGRPNRGRPGDLQIGSLVNAAPAGLGGDAPTAPGGGETSRARNHTGSLGVELARREPTHWRECQRRADLAPDDDDSPPRPSGGIGGSRSVEVGDRDRSRATEQP
jgi:hypothetical protein